MLLFDYLYRLIETPGEPERLQRKWKGVARALKAFLGEKEVKFSILETAIDNFAQNYYDFLKFTYKTQKRNSSNEADNSRTAPAFNDLVDFRQLIRRAIIDGVMTNIDILKDVEGFKRSKNVVTGYNADSELKKLLANKPEGLERWIDKYLISLLLCGSAENELSSIITSINWSDKTVELPNFGFSIRLDDLLISKIIDFQRGVSESVARDEEFKTKHQLAADPLSSLMQTLDVKLRCAGDVFTDWLILAQQAFSASESNIERLIRLRFSDNKDCPDDLKNEVQRIVDSMSQKYLKLDAENDSMYWFAVRTYGWSGEKAMLTLQTLDKKDAALKGKVSENIYCPCKDGSETTHTKPTRKSLSGNSQRTVLRNILFVKCTQPIIRRIEEIMPRIWVFKRKSETGSNYVHISSDELYRMHILLNHISDYQDIEIDFFDIQHKEKEAFPSFNEGQEVRLELYDYWNIPAIILHRDKKKSTKAMPYYEVVLGSSKHSNFKLSIPAMQIKGLADVSLQ